MKRAIVAIAVVAAALGGDAYGKTIYVDAGASGANNGTCWADAYVFLQDALTDANDSEKPVEIRVAKGVYQPDRSAAEPNGTGDRMATFRLINGVTIQGGFAGFSEPDPNTRDVTLYETVLSGDLDSNDIDVNNPADLLNEPSRAENAYHVVTGTGTDESAVLDGFTITGGNANNPSWFSPPEQKGGGMYNEGMTVVAQRRPTQPTTYSTTIANCAFVANSAIRGGGMYNYDTNPKISNCSFAGNSAYWFRSGDVASGGSGGGIHNEQSDPMLTNCVFTRNWAFWGAGISNYKSKPVVASCMFTTNVAYYSGGGMDNHESNPTVTDCVFSMNTSRADNGGAMANWNGGASVSNCIFSKNSARFSQDSVNGWGGGMSNFGASATITGCVFIGNLSNHTAGAVWNYQSDAVVRNCIFVGNRSKKRGGAIQNERCRPTITNCTIIKNQAGEKGGGLRNIRGVGALLKNSIVWGNSAPNGAQVAVEGTDSEPAAIAVAYSAVMGGHELVYVGPGGNLDWCAGNIDSDPCFADVGYWDPNETPEDANDDYWVMGDYHLKSQAGRWHPNSQAWIIDEVTSPCIDGGDPMSPIGLEPFPNGGVINIGAYGGTAEASKSYFGEPPCETIVAGDVNGDCTVNLLDFGIMAMHWLERH